MVYEIILIAHFYYVLVMVILNLVLNFVAKLGETKW